MRSPYRTAPEAPAPAHRSVFRGRDDARISLALWLLLLLPLTPFASRVGLSGPGALGMLAAAAVLVWAADRGTRRFSLHIGPSGMVLRRYRFLWVRTSIQRVSLEWNLHTEEDWDRDDHTSFAMSASRRETQIRGLAWAGWTVFGPTRDSPEMRATLEEMKAALNQHRKVVSSGDVGRERRRRSGDVAALFDRVEPGSVQYGPWGRVSSMRLSRGGMLERLRLPPGTLVEFEFADEWQAPSTPDRVTRVTMGGKAVWQGLPAVLRPGARVGLDHRRRVTTLSGAFDGQVRIQRVDIDGRRSIHFDRHGELTQFALASDLVWGPLRLPAGTEVQRMGADWLGFRGPGIRVEGAPDARPRRVHTSVIGRGKRAPLRELLEEPEGKVGPHLSLCEHEDGGAGERHRSVAFFGGGVTCARDRGDRLAAGRVTTGRSLPRNAATFSIDAIGGTP